MADSATICAIMVTYHPGMEYRRNLEAIAAQVHHVIIVDNGSDADTIALLTELGQQEHVSVILNQQNLGLGAAQNIGIKQALEQHYDWIILLDDDSRAEPG